RRSGLPGRPRGHTRREPASEAGCSDREQLMCGLCGVFLTETHWADSAVANAQEGARTRRHERMRRVALTNRVLRHYGAKITDWEGTAYLVSTLKGQTTIVPSSAWVGPADAHVGKHILAPT